MKENIVVELNFKSELNEKMKRPRLSRSWQSAQPMLTESLMLPERVETEALSDLVRNCLSYSAASELSED